MEKMKSNEELYDKLESISNELAEVKDLLLHVKKNTDCIIGNSRGIFEQLGVNFAAAIAADELIFRPLRKIRGE